MTVEKAGKLTWCDHSKDGFCCSEMAIVTLEVTLTRARSLCAVHASALIGEIVKVMAEVIEER